MTWIDEQLECLACGGTGLVSICDEGVSWDELCRYCEERNKLLRVVREAEALMATPSFYNESIDYDFNRLQAALRGEEIR